MKTETKLFDLTTVEGFVEFQEANSKQRIAVCKNKNSDYAYPEDADKTDDPFKVFTNFLAVEKLNITDAETGLLVRLTDKFMRIINMIKKMSRGEDAAVVDESIRDTILDFQNYLDLLLGIITLRADMVDLQKAKEVAQIVEKSLSGDIPDYLRNENPIDKEYIKGVSQEFSSLSSADSMGLRTGPFTLFRNDTTGLWYTEVDTAQEDSLYPKTPKTTENFELPDSGFCVGDINSVVAWKNKLEEHAPTIKVSYLSEHDIILFSRGEWRAPFDRSFIVEHFGLVKLKTIT